MPTASSAPSKRTPLSSNLCKPSAKPPTPKPRKKPSCSPNSPTPTAKPANPNPISLQRNRRGVCFIQRRKFKRLIARAARLSDAKSSSRRLRRTGLGRSGAGGSLRSWRNGAMPGSIHPRQKAFDGSLHSSKPNIPRARQPGKPEVCPPVRLRRAGAKRLPALLFQSERLRIIRVRLDFPDLRRVPRRVRRQQQKELVRVHLADGSID